MKRLLVLLPALLAIQVGVSPALAWTWPVDGPVLQTFRLGADPYEGGQHRGIDVGAPAGTPVAASAGGTVTFAGTVPGGGRAVTIQTADGYSVTLVHLGTIAVERGAAVGEGETIGSVGPSGAPELPVPYVHLGIRVTEDETGYRDPLTFLPPREVPPPAPGLQEAESAPPEAVASPGSDAPLDEVSPGPLAPATDQLGGQEGLPEVSPAVAADIPVAAEPATVPSGPTADETGTVRSAAPATGPALKKPVTADAASVARPKVEPLRSSRNLGSPSAERHGRETPASAKAGAAAHARVAVSSAADATAAPAVPARRKDGGHALPRPKPRSGSGEGPAIGFASEPLGGAILLAAGAKAFPSGVDSPETLARVRLSEGSERAAGSSVASGRGPAWGQLSLFALGVGGAAVIGLQAVLACRRLLRRRRAGEPATSVEPSVPPPAREVRLATLPRSDQECDPAALRERRGDLRAVLCPGLERRCTERRLARSSRRSFRRGVPVR
jgi:hypothetical protein